MPSDTLDDTQTGRRPRNLREDDESNNDQDQGQQRESEQQSPEEALAHLRQQLEGESSRRTEAEARAAAAQQREESERQRATRAETAVVERTTASLESAIQNNTQRRQSAAAALRIAREAGDIDAEVAAQQELSDSTTTLAMLQADKARMANAPKPTAQPTRAAPTGPSAEAQAWINAHPRFRTDGDYYDDAISSHNKALRAGYTEGSREYVQYIDRRMSELYPEDNKGRMTQQGNTRRPASSFAAPPSRGTDNTNRGSQMDLVRRVGGPDATMEDMAQFAEVNGFKRKDGSPDTERYLKAQQQILDERRGGRSTGLSHSDEETMR